VWLDLLLFAVLLAFTSLGAWRGALESGLRLAGWLGGYAAAVAAAAWLGAPAAAALGVAAWLGMPIAGTAAFLLVQLALAVAIALARRRRAELDPGALDRILGAALGAARGALVVVLLGWLALLADALRSQGALASLPSTERSVAASWSGVVVESGAAAVLGQSDPGARAAVALAARPAATLESFREVLDHPRMQALQRDRAFWSRFEKGDVEGALALPSARALVADASLRRRLADLGLVERAAAEHPVAFERALAQALGEASARVARLRSDPEVRALLEDPAVIERVERRDAIGLLSDPRLQRALERARAS
jgi:membrane protein required for colicin V production